MAGKYNAGSVSAKITLDTSQFEEAIANLKKQTEDIKKTVNQSAKGTESAIENLVETTNKLKEQQSELSAQFGNTSKDIKKEADALKKLSPEIEKNAKNVTDAVKANDNLTKSNKNVTQSLKDVEKQASKTGKKVSALQKDFTKAFYNQTHGFYTDNGMLDFEPIYAGLKGQFKAFVKGKKEFEKLIQEAVKATNTSLIPVKEGETGVKFTTLGQTIGKINVSKLTAPYEELKTSIDNVTESTGKATEATKELTVASQDLEGVLKGIFGRKQSYELKDLVENYEKLPLAVQTAVDGIRRSISKMEFGGYPLHGGYWSGNGGDLAEQLFMEEIEAWAKFIPKFNIDKLLKKVFPIKKMSDRLSLFDEMHYWDKWYGGINKDKSFGKPIYTPPYQIDEITGLKKTLEYLQELEITSRKTGEAVEINVKVIEQETTAVKQLGEATKHTATELKILKDIMDWVNRTSKTNHNHPINEGYINSGLYLGLENKYVRDITGMSMDTVISPAKLRRRFQREIKPLFDELRIGFEVATHGFDYPIMDFSNMVSETEFKQLIGEVKEISVVSEDASKKLDAETKSVEKLGEATKHTATEIQLLKEMFDHFTYRKDLGDTNAPFVKTYKMWEQDYKNLLSKLDPKFAKRIKKQFQNTFNRLMGELGVTASPETVLLAEGSQKTANFLGRRIGSYDLTNLISEKEFKQLIGEVEELGATSEDASKKLIDGISKAVTQANQLSIAIEKVGTATKTTTNLVKELGLATDEFGFVYLGELISQFDSLPAHIQKAVSNISRIIQKGSNKLYPKNAMQEFQNDLGYASFNLLKNGIPFNIGDPRYYGDLRWLDNIQITMEQVQEQKALLDQILQTFGRFFPENYKKINDVVYGNNRFLREDLQFTLDALKEMEIHTKRISRYMDILRANRYGFLTGQDKYDKHYLRSTLENGFDTYSRIKPLNVKDRAFTPSDKDFLERIFKPILSYYDTGSSNRPIRSLFKYPAWKQLTTSDKINMPYSTEYLRNFDDTKEGYEEFIKWAHTRMRRALRLMNIELSKELSKTQEGVRVWFENLGKWQNMYSLDISKTFPFKDIKEFQAYIDKVTTSMAYLGIGIDATAMKTTKLNYALKENVNWQERVGREQEKARIKAEQLANAKFPNLKVGVELWGTAEEFRRAEIGFRNLISILDNIQPSAKKVTNDIKQIGTSAEQTTTKVEILRERLALVGSTRYGIAPESITDDFIRVGTIDNVTKKVKLLTRQLEELDEVEVKTTKDAELLLREAEKLVQSSIKFSKNLGRDTLFNSELDHKLRQLLGYPENFDSAMFNWGQHLAKYNKGDRMWNNDSKHFNDGVKGGIPLLTWEQVKKLPITKSNRTKYGSSLLDSMSSKQPNYSPLDIYNKMYSYEELMKHFWELPSILQGNLLGIKQILDKKFQGKIPKNFEKAGIWQYAMGDVVFGKPHAYDGRYYDPLPIKGIPVMQTHAYDKNHPKARKGDYFVDMGKDPRLWSVEEVEDFYISIGRLDKSLVSTTIDVKKLGEAEETTAKSTETLTNKIKQASIQANNLKTALKTNPLGQVRKQFEDLFFDYDLPENIQTALDGLYRTNYRRNHRWIGKDQWLNEVLAWGKQIEQLDLDNFIRAYDKIGNPERLANATNPFTYLGTFRRTGGNNGRGTLVDDWGKLTDYGKFGEASILRAVLKQMEQVEIVSAKAGVTFKFDFVEPLEQGVECLDSFVGEIPKAVSEEKNLVVETKKVGETARTTAKEVEQLVMAVERVGKPHNIFGSTGLFSNWATVPKLTSKEFLDAYVTYRNFMKEISQPAGISGYQSNVSYVLDVIREKEAELIRQTEELSLAYQQVWESGQYAGMSIYQQFSGVIPAVIRAREEVAKLGKANTEVVEWIGKWSKGSSPAKFLRLFSGQIGNFKPVIRDFENKAKRAFKSIEEGAKKASESIIRLPVKSIGRLPIALGKATDEGKRFEKQMNNTGETIKRTSSYYNNLFKQLNNMKFGDEKHGFFTPKDSRNLKTWNIWGDGFARSGETIANTTKSIKTFDNTVLTTKDNIKKNLVEMMYAFREFAQINRVEITGDMIKSWKEALAEVEGFEQRYRALTQRMYDLSRGRGYWQNKGKTSTGYGRTLTDQILSSYGLLGSTVVGGQVIDFDKFRSEIEASIFGKNGRINTVGYSDYIANISEITSKLQEANAPVNAFKESLKLLSEALKVNANSMTDFVGKSEGVIQSLTQMAMANERFAQQPTQVGVLSEVEKLSQVLNHFSGVSEKSKTSLSGLKNQMIAIKDSAEVLGQSLLDGTLSQEQYEKEIVKLSERLKQLGADTTETIRKLNMVDKSIKNTSDASKKGKQSVREFGTELGKGEEYANNLYRGLQKVRSIIISMKTILRMMGGLYVWQFAFDLLEGAKETYLAKNEMESLLAKNTKVNTSGIRTFNKALDETVSRFQKINKYSLGETGASIGLEFNLTAQEMSKSLPVIAMIQNEYVRAGRTVEEASLAVKDILQGEFMRLSRETGIGKEDLIEKYGWNGDKEDVLDLMKALEKAGKARHWDLFAEKASSLGDVITITQSRFAELGAEMGTHAEPVIVGAFNAILGAVDGLKKGFEGLGSFGKSVFEMGGVVAGVTALSGAYLILAKNVGIADIAQMGLGKSLATSLLHLNRVDVATHGLFRTLIATSSGVDVATTANVKFRKVLAGRVLGLNQAVIAEKGLSGAMTASILKTKEGVDVGKLLENSKKQHLNLDKATLLTKNKDITISGKLIQQDLTRSQRLAYLTTNMKYNEVAELSRGKALLKTATSAKVLINALKLLSAVSLIAWGASIMAWTDKVKTYVDGYYNVVDNGESLIKDAKSDLDDTKQSLADVNKQIDEYNAKGKNTTALLREKNGLLKDTAIAEQNVANTQKAVELAKVKSERLQKQRSRIDTHHTTQLAEAYMRLGLSSEEATLKANDYYSQVSVGSYYAEKALEIYGTHLTNATNHSLAYAESLQKQGVDQEKVNQYMMDYNLVAEETAENWRKFNEGDIWAGASAIVGELKQAWTDFVYTPEFDKISKGLQEWFEWLKPSLETVIGYLKELGSAIVDAFSWLTSTDAGKTALTLTTIGTVLGIGALKMAKWLTGAKSVGTVLKDLGGKLKDRIKDWKDYNDVTGDKKSSPDTQTDVEGKKNPNYRYKKYESWGELGTDIKQDFMGEARRFAKVAGQIALAMGVLSVAIASLLMPALALAGVGILIKGHEGEIKAGIEGIKLIAPTVITMLIPIIALTKVMDKWGDKLMNPKMIVSLLGGIVVGLGAVALSIAMLIPSIWALGALGDQFLGMETQVKKGAEAMKIVAESLIYLLPFVPAMVLGIALVDAMFTALPLGVSALIIVAGGIALGMGLVAEAIWTLQAPLLAIGDIGKNFKDLSNVKQGAEALKLTAEALGYVSDAVGSLAEVVWEDLIANVGTLVAQKLNISLSGLTGKGGFFEQLNTFMTEFNSDTLKIETPAPDKVEALASVAEGINTISNAMKAVKSAMDNIPDEFKSSNSSISYDMESNTTSISSVDVKGYFDTFKEPLSQLKTFIDDFNTSEEFDFGDGIDPERVSAIQEAGTMIETLNNAVTQVKTVMQGIGDSQWATSYAEGGYLTAIGNSLVHMSGVGAVNNGSVSGYKSSLGSSLQEMEDIISDLFTFQNNVNSLTGGTDESGNVEGASAMVTAVQTAISNLAQSLSDAIPTFEGKGNAISGAIVKGIKDGMVGLGGDISSQIATAVDNAKPTATTYGKGLGSKLKNGFKDTLKIKSVTETEVNSTITYLEGKKPEFYNKGYDLGDALSTGYKDGNDMHSPGIIARSTEEELGRVAQYFSDAQTNLPQMAFNLGSALSSNFNFDLGLSNIQLPNLTGFTESLAVIPNTVTGVKDSVSTDFNTMKTNVGSSFGGIVTTTRTSLANMQGQTTKNIGAIRTSWKGMQSALIASAENIRKQTGEKIGKLKSNMADFWQKIQNPAQLIGSAGGQQTGTLPMRWTRTPAKGQPHYAGGSIFPKRISKTDPSDYLEEGALCRFLNGGKPCYSGGWDFNWSPSISKKFKGWKTHFNAFNLDKHLNVGKFENSNFPVKGNAEIFKDFISAVIGATTYEYYYDSQYSPYQALAGGHFNCWDGTQVILALARAFGLGGSIGHGSWGSDGHVWAIVDGIGVIDPTAIQKGYGFRSPKVSGYGAGSPPKSSNTQNNANVGNTYNTNIHIDVHGDDVEVNDKKINKETGRQILELLGINPTTGR